MKFNDIPLRHDVARLRERFAASVTINPVTGCHEWQGQVDTTPGHLPYGQFSIGHGRRYRAHRVAWVLFKGFLPDDAQVLHECDVARCVNPEHLFLGTRADNMADMAAKNRSVSGQRNWTNKLTPEQVQEIRLASGAQADIAERYGVGQNNVGRIKRGETWRHLPWPSR